MKGQISIDYYIALIIFIFFVVYFLFRVSNLVPDFIGRMEEQRMRSEVYQFSELLANDFGNPPNWETLSPGSIKRIGLSDQSRNKTNLLSVAKVAALNSLCASQGQSFLKSKIVTDLEFSVFLIDRTDSSVDLSCSGPDTNATTGEPLSRSFTVTTKRVVALNDGRFGELAVQMWRPAVRR